MNTSDVNEGRFFIQNFLYLSNIINLAINGSVLFDQKYALPFENCPHFVALTPRYEKFSTGIFQVNSSNLNEKQKMIIEKVYDSFKYASFLDFYDISHEDVAGLDSFKNKTRKGRDSYFIDVEKFREEYKKQYSNFLK